jgi:Zn-dependent M16 (insulinase) family peptidase
MLEEPCSFWLKLLGNYLGPDKPSVTTRGRPSADLQQKMAIEEEKRIEKQREDLGKEGLLKADANLRAAMENNEVVA